MLGPAVGSLVRSAALAALLLALGLLAGCARHIDVIPLGASPAPNACVVEVDVQSVLCGGRAVGTTIELYRETNDGPGESGAAAGPVLISRFALQAEGPAQIVDLEPGCYRLDMLGPPGAGSRTVSKSFTLEPGRSVALCYDDNERARRFWRNLGVGTGLALVVTGAVAVDVALVVGSCGLYCYPFVTAVVVTAAFD